MLLVVPAIDPPVSQQPGREQYKDGAEERPIISVLANDVCG
jgi:hypothetical protein